MASTNWTNYYSERHKINQITRNYVQKILIREINEFCSPSPSIIEGGGANSCFFSEIYRQIKPLRYTVLDNNDYGLRLFIEATQKYSNVSALNFDFLSGDLPESCEKGDLVFSAGLIEHFDKVGTQTVIASHFHLAKPGGIVLLTFPTPTKKYRFCRKTMELAHVWKFYDERPLCVDEVIKAASPFGVLLKGFLMEKMPLTQQMLIFSKK